MKPLSTKGAIGLSMNVLVIIIISIVILVGSVSFLYNLINKSEEFRQGLDQQTESQLKQLLIDQGKLTAVYPYKVTMSHGEEKVFGIGVLNVNIDSGASFSVNICLYFNCISPSVTCPSPPSAIFFPTLIFFSTFIFFPFFFF